MADREDQQTVEAMIQLIQSLSTNQRPTEREAKKALKFYFNDNFKRINKN